MIVVVAGVSGSGKSTVGALLAERLGWEFADGDKFHPVTNIAKMLAGVPLTDADRLPWLQAICAWMDKRIAAGQSAVIACSALKRAYRDELLAAGPQVKLVFLQVDPDVDAARLAHRRGHFFPANLARSQFAALESPEPAEGVLVVSAQAKPAEVVDKIVSDLHLAGGSATTPEASS